MSTRAARLPGRRLVEYQATVTLAEGVVTITVAAPNPPAAIKTAKRRVPHWESIRLDEGAWSWLVARAPQLAKEGR